MNSSPRRSGSKPSVNTELRQTLIRALAADGQRSSDFDLNPGAPAPAPQALRPASVLVAVTARGTVLLTKRSARLKHHPGQIAFPGGKQDDTDPSPQAAALRETEEEIGLPRAQVEILGNLPSHETVTAYRITPVLALVRGTFTPVPEAGEVDEIFEVPLAHLIAPANYRVEGRYWRGQLRHYYVVPYGPYYIWGATARILRALADRMAP